jgi:hypothetical protein
MPATSPKSAIATIVERSSVATNLKKTKTLSRKHSSSKVGALANGGEVNIWGFKSISFILQYFVIGFIYFGMPATIYGVFNGHLNVPSLLCVLHSRSCGVDALVV